MAGKKKVIKAKRLAKVQEGGAASAALLSYVPTVAPTLPLANSNRKSAAPLNYTPFFTTPEQYKEYKRLFQKVSGEALDPQDDLRYLKYTPYHKYSPDPKSKTMGFDCINGTCGLDEAAGLRWSHAPNAGRYFSNKEFLANIRKGKEDYIELNTLPDFDGTLYPGDHFIVLGKENVPHHSMKVLDVERDKTGKPLRYRMIENDGNTKFHGQTTMTVEEFWDRFYRGDEDKKSKRSNDLIVMRPGRYLAQHMTKEQKAQLAAEEQHAQERARQNYAVEHPLGNNYFKWGGEEGVNPVQNAALREVGSYASNNFFNRLFRRDAIMEEQIRDQYRALKKIPLRKLHVDFAQGADADTLAQLGHNPEYVHPEDGVRKAVYKGVVIPKGKMWVNSDVVNPKFINVRYSRHHTTNIDRRGLTGDDVKRIAVASHALHGDPVYDGLTQELGDLLVAKYGKEDMRNNGGVDAYIRGLLSDEPEYKVYQEEMSFVPQGLRDKIVDYIKSGKVPRAKAGGVVSNPSSKFFTGTGSKGKGGEMGQRGQGRVSTQGYKADSPDRFNAFNVIPSNQITMQGVPHPVLGTDDLGNQQLMLPGAEYIYPGSMVFELPVRHFMQTGGSVTDGKKLMQLKPSRQPIDSMVGPYGTLSQQKQQLDYKIKQDEIKNRTAEEQEKYEYEYFGKRAGTTPYQIEWLKTYVSSPKYLERLEKEFGNKEAALVEQQARLRNLQKTKINYKDDIPGAYGNYTPNRFKGTYLGKDNIWHDMRFRYDEPDSSYLPGPINLLKAYNPKSQDLEVGRETTPVHEVIHSLTDGDFRIPEATMRMIYDNTSQQPDKDYRYGDMAFGYFNDPTEFNARMGVLRYLLGQEKIHDARVQDFTEDHYNKMMANPVIQGNINYQKLMETLKGNEEEKKKRLIYLMNTIASRSNGRESTVAKYGGGVDREPGAGSQRLRTAQQGGPVDETENQRNWLLSYLQSPKYTKERLQPDLDRQDVTKELDARVQNLQNVPVKDSRELGWYQGSYMPREYKGMMYKQGWIPAAPQPDPIFGIETPGTLYLKPEFRAGQTPEAKFSTTPAHEFSHAVDDGGFRIPDRRIEKIYQYTRKNTEPGHFEKMYAPPKTNVPDQTQYRIQVPDYQENLVWGSNQGDGPVLNVLTPEERGEVKIPFKGRSVVRKFTGWNDPSEFDARLNASLYKMHQLGLYDPLTQDFDKTVYQRVLNDPRMRENSDFQELHGMLKGDDNQKQAAMINLINPSVSRGTYGSFRYDGSQESEVHNRESGVGSQRRMQVGGGYTPDNGLYPYGMINPFDVDPYGYPGNRPATAPVPVLPATGSYPGDTGLYPYGVINPFGIDAYRRQRRVAAPAAAAPPVDNGLYSYGVINPFDVDPSYRRQRPGTDLSQVWPGKIAGFQNFMKNRTVLSKDNSVATEQEVDYLDPDIAKVGQMKGFKDFMQKKTILSKDNQNPFGVNAPFADPKPKPAPEKTYWGPNIEAAAGVVGSMAALNTALESGGRNRTEEQVRLRNLGDARGPLLPGDLDYLRGDYSVNEGYFRPQRYVPIQFSAVPKAESGGFFDSNYIPGYFDNNEMKLPDLPVAKSFSTDNTFKANYREDVSPDLKRKPNKEAIHAFNYYLNVRKLKPHVAAGIVGNLFQESRMDPTIVNSIGAYGLAQWLGPRRKAYYKHAEQKGFNPNSFEGQLDWVLDEDGWGPKVLKLLNSSSVQTPTDAAILFADKFERMAKHEAHYEVRSGVAENLMAYYNKQMAKNNRYQQGGEYTVSPKQLEFILAHGGEVEFL